MSDDHDAERFRDYFKFIITVDAASLVGAFTLRRELGLEDPYFAASAVMLGISAYLCIAGMHALTLFPIIHKSKLARWFVTIVFSCTSLGVGLAIGGSVLSQWA